MNNSHITALCMHLQAPRLAFRRAVRPAGGTVVVVETTLDYYYHNLQKDLSLPPLRRHSLLFQTSRIRRKDLQKFLL